MTADLGPAATPRPIPTPEARMTAARQPGPTFATYLDRHDRDQLDARAATAEQERDEALDARDVLRHQLDQQSAILASKRNTITALAAELGATQEAIATIRDAAERIDRAIAHHETQQQEQALKHVSVVGNCIACGSRCPNGRCPNDAPSPGLGSPADRAQDGIRPAAWEQQAVDAASAGLGEAWCVLSTDPTAARRLATAAVRAIIDAGLAGDGGRCRKCGSGFPRTLPAGQDPLCWSCDSEEQVGLDEPADRAQDLPALVYNAISRALQDVWPISVPLPVVRERCTAAVLEALDGAAEKPEG